MQLLQLVNNLLRKDEQTEKKDLWIITYSVIPLSTNTGLIGWVQNCDTLQELMKEYRHSNHIAENIENRLILNMTSNYDK